MTIGESVHYVHEYQSPIGALAIAGDGERITGLWLAGQKYFQESLPGGAVKRRIPLFDQAAEWLDAYFGGERPEPSLPLAPPGTPFRQAVWKALLAIPYGTVTTYGAIAKMLSGDQNGVPTSARAVGGAVGKNRISILIPCHRVIGADGGLTGYAGGIDRKKWLLRLESADLSGLC